MNMTNMQTQILIAIASLALLCGCGGKDKETAARPSSVPQFQLAEVNPQKASAGPDLITGEKVYKSTCSICHKSGLNGAPRIGSKDNWEPRLAQGKDLLYDRAIHGYRGKKGSMPARGSNVRLSDDEVKAAVDYMVAHAVPMWSMER